jgi:Ca-activated chloride channel family protein
MRFAALYNFWLLLLLPLLVSFFAWALLARRRALVRFARWPLAEKLTRDVSRGRQFWKYGLLGMGTLLLILALSGPQFGTKLEMARRKGVDVILVLDVSRSMAAEDVKPSRLERAKHQIRGLVDLLEGDRVGLVVFAGKAFVQCPLTTDYGAVEMFLAILDVGSVSVQGTAIGDALRLATRSFDPGDLQHKAIVLFTDGEDHVGQPLEAAREAAVQGVRVFAVGLGTPDGELIPQAQEGGGFSYHKDERGNYVKTRLDEDTLQAMALETAGDYFRSTLGGAELEAIYGQIAQMEQKEIGSTRLTRYEERFQWPLLLALCCFFVEALLGDARVQSREWKGRFA